MEELSAEEEPEQRCLVGIQLNHVLRERVRREAQVRGLTDQWLLEHLVIEGMDRLIPAQEFRLTRRPGQ